MAMPEGLSDQLVQHFEEELGRHKGQVEREQRLFFVASGARNAVAALLRAGAIDEQSRKFVENWMGRGGMSRLEINGETIVPPGEA